MAFWSWHSPSCQFQKGQGRPNMTNVTKQENTIASTTRPILSCPECGRCALEVEPMKTHWTVNHADEHGDFPEPEILEVRE